MELSESAPVQVASMEEKSITQPRDSVTSTADDENVTDNNNVKNEVIEETPSVAGGDAVAKAPGADVFPDHAEPDSSMLGPSGEPQPTAAKAKPSRPPFDIDPFPVRDVVPPVVVELVYWRRPMHSGVAFASCFLVLVAFSLFSAISVLAHAGLLVLCGTFAFVVFKRVGAAIQKIDAGHPFEKYLEGSKSEVVPGFDEDAFKANADSVVRDSARFFRVLRHYYLVADVADSLKFGLFLYLLTHVGAVFNFLTLVTIALVYCFTVPKFYEAYQVQIDAGVAASFDAIQTHAPAFKAFVADKLEPFRKKVTQLMASEKAKAN